MRFATLAFLMAPACAAATITSDSLATDLIGGIVTVTHFGGSGMSTATFVAGPAGSVIASSPGSAGFELIVSGGDTFFSIWTLTNTDPSTVFLNTIVSVTIDLTLSAGGALFDNDSLPSSPGSAAGVLGVVYSAGAAIASATETTPWLDPVNTGDMFRAATISFGGGGIGPLGSSSWTDDTDSTAVPEPAAAAAIGAGLLALCGLKMTRRLRQAIRT